MSKAANDVVMRGEIGVPLSQLSAADRAHHEEQLTLHTSPWDEREKPERVECWRTADGVMWFPRYYDRGLWSQATKWDWTLGLPYDFDLLASPDPERGQVQAIPAMVSHVKQHGGGILVAPTGTGKTLMGLYIAATLGRFIGALVYNGHMVDNWMDHCASVLGLSEDQVGLVQEDRCDLGRPVTIMMIQSLLARRYPEALYEQIGFLLGDECNRYGAPQWMKVARQFPARYRMGMSADPTRKDDLDRIVGWTFGDIGHTAKRVRTQNTQTPSVILVRYKRFYDIRGFCKWERDSTGWKAGDGHPTKYAKMVAADDHRNQMLTIEICNAAQAGRQILVFSQIVDHLTKLKAMTDEELKKRGLLVTTGQLKAGMKKPEREKVFVSDVRFCTYQMGRDAMNIPQLDTLFFATPSGNPLQPIGRLREKSEGYDRKPLMVIDVYDDTDYARNRMFSRRRKYQKLGMSITYVERPGPEKVRA